MSQRITRIKTSQRIARMYTNKNEKLYSLNSCYSRNSLINLLVCYINMRNFYLEYQIFQTVSGKLTWSHYCELLGMNTIKIMSQRIARINTNREIECCLFYLCYSYYSCHSRNSLTYSLNSYHSCNSLINSLANSYYSCHSRNSLTYSLNSYHSRNSLIYSLTYSLIKTGEKIGYFV